MQNVIFDDKKWRLVPIEPPPIDVDVDTTPDKE